MTARPPRRWVRLGLCALAVVAFVAIVVVRQGPPSGGDTTAVTTPTSALLRGDLAGAATGSVEPDPPGYAWFAAALVAPLRHTFGSGNWCTTADRAAALRRQLEAEHLTTAEATIGSCGPGAALPPWVRSQATVSLLAWLVLVVGAVALLRAGGAGRGWSEIGLVWALALLPAASDAIVGLYHPQDLLCLGLGLGAVAAVLRRHWVLAGLLFGLALVTKQFALLLLIPALVAVPGRRRRIEVCAVAASVVGALVAPMLVAAPRRTVDDLVGIGSAGAVRGATWVGLAGASPLVVSALARGVPVLAALVATGWVGRRLRRRGGGPVEPSTLVALVLACLAGRLVFESVIIAYYLLGASVAFLLLDLVQRRPPTRSLSWVAASALFLALPIHQVWLIAAGTLAMALAAVAVGLHTVWEQTRPTSGAGAAGDLAGDPAGRDRATEPLVGASAGATP